MHCRELFARISLMAGKIIGSVKLNRLIMTSENGRNLVLKRRCWYTPVLVFIGNIYIFLLGLKIRILRDREWLQREKTIYNDLYNELIAVRPGGWLEVPCIGEVLSVLLAKPAITDANKLKALTAVTLDLHRMHQMPVEENGKRRLFSHGDACARNVACQSSLDRVHWFDFEIVHSSDCSDTWRHADDLRALLFSSLRCLPESLLSEAVHAMFEAYADISVWRDLHAMIATGSLDLNTYHLAQMQMTAKQHSHYSNIALKLLEVKIRPCNQETS